MKALTRRLLIVAFLAIGGFCFWQALPGLMSEKPLNSNALAGALGVTNNTHSVSIGPPSDHRRSLTTPIQDLRVGMRVVGRNPLEEDAQRDLPQPDPVTWRLVRARIELEPGKFCDLQLLRPLEWIEHTGATAGATIWVELPEMYVAGIANVIAVEGCPQLEVGENPIITGTFQHLASKVVDLNFEGTNPLGCTSEHPFWSDTRGDFIPASQLEVGEEILTAYGNSARVTSIVPRAGPHTVYGLEVYGEHVYGVGEFGLLVHNASGHSATVRHRNSRGTVLVKAKRFISGKTGRRTPTNAQRARSHTEHKIARHFGPRLRKGHVLDIEGTFPPCQGYAGGCRRAMRHLAQETGAKIRYKWKNEAGQTVRWEAVRVDGGVQVRQYESGRLVSSRVWEATKRSNWSKYVPF